MAGFPAWSRRAAAMLVAPARRWAVMARLRRLAKDSADRDELDGASFDASMRFLLDTVGDGHVLPGKGFQLCVETRLVRFRGERVVRPAGVEVFGVGALGVRGVGGDDHVGEVVEGVHGRDEFADLAGLSPVSSWAGTTADQWSSMASRCRGATSVPSEPRRRLPSTATTRRFPCGTGVFPDALDPRASSDRSLSGCCKRRRIVDSHRMSPEIPDSPHT